MHCQNIITNFMKFLKITLIYFSFLMLSCQTESIFEIMDNETAIEALDQSKCEKKLVLQFDTEDLVINFGQGWQNQSFQTFELEWIDDNTLKIKSYYAIIDAEMQQTSGFGFQNYNVLQSSPFEIYVSLDEPSLWTIYGEHYHMFNINLVLDSCNSNQRFL